MESSTPKQTKVTGTAANNKLATNLAMKMLARRRGLANSMSTPPPERKSGNTEAVLISPRKVAA